MLQLGPRSSTRAGHLRVCQRGKVRGGMARRPYLLPGKGRAHPGRRHYARLRVTIDMHPHIYIYTTCRWFVAGSTALLLKTSFNRAPGIYATSRDDRHPPVNISNMYPCMSFVCWGLIYARFSPMVHLVYIPGSYTWTYYFACLTDCNDGSGKTSDCPTTHPPTQPKTDCGEMFFLAAPPPREFFFNVYLLC